MKRFEGSDVLGDDDVVEMNLNELHAVFSGWYHIATCDGFSVNRVRALKEGHESSTREFTERQREEAERLMNETLEYLHKKDVAFHDLFGGDCI